MNKLSCSVTNCAHNENRLCCLSGVKVGGATACTARETCCESFSCGGTGMQNSVFSQKAEENTNIKCSACDCRYNQDNCCHAERVSIAGNGASQCSGTRCDTFCEK